MSIKSLLLSFGLVLVTTIVFGWVGSDPQIRIVYPDAIGDADTCIVPVNVKVEQLNTAQGVDYGEYWLIEETNEDTIVSPISQWKMNDDAATKVVIDSVGSATGTASANTNTMSVAGKINTALEFVAADKEIITITTFTESAHDNFSVSFWVWPTSGGSQEICAWYHIGGSILGFVGLRDTGELIMWSHVGNNYYAVTTESPLTQDTWNHVVALFQTSDNTYHFFVNTVEIASDTTGTPRETYDTFADMYIGGRPADVNLFDGKLDDICIYDFALTDTNIIGLYNDRTEDENPLDGASYIISAAEWTAAVEIPFADTPINDINREAHFVISELGTDKLTQDSSYYIVGIGKDLNGDYSSDSTLIPGTSMDGDGVIADSAIVRFTVEGTR